MLKTMLKYPLICFMGESTFVNYDDLPGSKFAGNYAWWSKWNPWYSTICNEKTHVLLCCDSTWQLTVDVESRGVPLGFFAALVLSFIFSTGYQKLQSSYGATGKNIKTVKFDIEKILLVFKRKFLVHRQSVSEVKMGRG